MNPTQRRIEIIRQYLTDVEYTPDTILESTGAMGYLAWNFSRAVESAIAEHDIRRKIERTTVGAGADDDTHMIESPMVEFRIGMMAKLLSTEKGLPTWFHEEVMSPVVAEEDRILAFSSDRRIWTLGIRGHVDRSGNVIRFKAWEAVRFPGVTAKIPDRFPAPA